MKINQIIVGITAVAVLLGTVFVTTQTGLWKTTSTKVPDTIDSGDFQGQYDPADIRGSYTFGEISDLFDIPVEDLASAFVLDTQNASILKCKDLESMYTIEEDKEVGTASVRLFVALYKGLPITLTDTVYLPQSAEAILVQAGKMTEEQAQFVASHTVQTMPADTQNGE